MSNTQYAVCHLQRGSGNDSGMSCHIERKDAKGKKYVPDNADAGRTHLNRELVRFPEGVSNRTEAIQHRIDTAGLRRKVGKNQTKAIRVILTGTHEQMMEIANGGRLDSWIDANLKWLKDTFGEENLVSCVLHMDEKTPHLHATIVPIVTTERLRKKREGEKKYATKSGARLSADDVMRRSKLHEYQNSYAAELALASFYVKQGDYKLAQQVLDQAKSHQRLHNLQTLIQTDILLGQNRVNEALAVIQSPASIMPENRALNYKLAEVYIQQKRPELAQPVLNRFLNTNPRDVSAWRLMQQAAK